MKIRKLIFLMAGLFLVNSSCSNNFIFENLPVQLKIKKAPYTKDANSISNNGIYFIKNIGNSQIIDIPNSSYKVGTKPICYTAHYFANQRYVITKEFENTYRIRPLNAQNLVFGIDSNELILKEEEYSDTALFLDKFKFIRYGSTNYFYITDYYGKYLTLSDKSTATKSSMVLENSINSSNLNYYLWSFVETDSLNVNCVQQDTISANSNKYYNIRVPYSVSYRVETDVNNVTIIIYDNSSGDALCQNVSGQKYVDYNFNKNIDYSVRIFNNTSSSRVIQTKLSPKKTAFMYGVYDYKQHHHDRVTPLNSTKNYYESNNLYPIVYGNIGKSRLINSIENNSINNWIPFNSNNVVVRAHGTSGLFQSYNGIQTESIEYYELPDMTNVNFASWVMCESASNNTENNYVTNIAREAVVHGAKFSVGFKGSIFTDLATTYSVGLGLAASYNHTPLFSTYYAVEYTKSIHWVFYENKDNYPENKIWDPYCYYRDSSNMIVYSIANVVDPVVFQDDGGLKKDSTIILQEDTVETDFDKNYAEINHFDKNYKLLKIGDNLTNIIYNENTYFEDLNLLKNMLKNYSDYTDLVLLKVDDTYKIIKIIVDPDSLSCKYYDLSCNEYISSELFIEYSNNFVSLSDSIY